MKISSKHYKNKEEKIIDWSMWEIKGKLSYINTVDIEIERKVAACEKNKNAYVSESKASYV